MMDVTTLKQWIDSRLEGTDYQLITLKMSAEQDILVEIERLGMVDVDFCAELNRYLVEKLDAEGLDYSLEVGSVSLTDPFKTRLQYEKNLGHPVVVLTNEGKKVRGQLVSVDDETFAVDVEVMAVVEGKKRKQKMIQTEVFSYANVKQTQYELKV